MAGALDLEECGDGITPFVGLWSLGGRMFLFVLVIIIIVIIIISSIIIIIISLFQVFVREFKLL